MDVEGLVYDNSDSLSRFRDWINNNLLKSASDTSNRYKEVEFAGEALMFKEMEVVLKNDLVFFSAEFDDLFIGRRQNWSALEAQMREPSTFKNMP